MGKKKLNCWEYMKCERQPDGNKMDEMGVCPASLDDTFDGINFGKNAGRICWAVAGTCCGGNVQGTYAEKRDSCTSCQFYKLVQDEEGDFMSGQKFLSFFLDYEDNPFFKKLVRKNIESGACVINQGDILDEAYVIQSGSCLLLVEKDEILHPVGHRGRGDIVGLVSFLTGEPQTAHAEAETDMELWVLDRNLFEYVNSENPELYSFLTEIVADQFDSKRPVADRSIGKYMTTGIIGRGGFSIVYKGMHTALNMPVAIKMLRHNLAMDSDFQRTFRNEANVIAGLDHENIIKVYDIEERFRTIFIVEELVRGESLKDMLGRLGKIPIKLALDFLIQICSGLEYAHNKGIIHRDVNPTNVFVKQDDRVKLLDFGLACPIGTEDFASFGNLGYMAPEQIESEVLDERTDIYALGITAFEMVTGKKPFPVDDATTLAKMHVSCDIPDPAELTPNMPEDMRTFIQKACCRDPGGRYQNISQALNSLQHLAEEIGLKKYSPSNKNYNMASLFIAYKDEQELEFKCLIDYIHSKAKELGIVLKSASFTDI